MVKRFGYLVTGIVLFGFITTPVQAAPIIQIPVLDFLEELFRPMNSLQEMQTPEEQNQEDENLLLPDLVPSEPDELYVSYEDGVKKLRFSTTVKNIGTGTLELIGKSDVDKEVTEATQRISLKNGGEKDIQIGTFEFHPDHLHWHVEDFYQFQLWTIAQSGEREEMITSTDKMSFCLWDEMHVDPGMENSPEERAYTAECETDVQGISVGWSDTYSAGLPGQELIIDSVPDGEYAIRTILNPEKIIHESTYTNNDTTTRVTLEGDTITKRDN